jgi:hypothetical protein
VTASPSTSTEPAPAEPNAAALTQAQTLAALPPAAAIGQGYKATDTLAHQDGDDGAKVSPARCQVVYDGLNNSALLREPASSQRDYQKSQLGPFVSVYVSSHPSVPPATVYARIAAARGRCSSFVETDTDGTRTRFRVIAWDAPKVGDRTVALRMTGTSDGVTMHAEILETAVGRNTIGVAQFSLGPPDTALTLKAMNATLARLPH